MSEKRCGDCGGPIDACSSQVGCVGRGDEIAVDVSYAAGVADERARCKRIVIYEGHNHGAGDDGPEDRAQSMSDSIVKAIDDGRAGSDWPT